MSAGPPQAELNVPTVDTLVERIADARRRISPHALTTPLVPLSGRGLLGKAENLQRSGSFKLRGALNRTMIAAEAGIRSIVTASTGNHGLAVAMSCKILGLHCEVFLHVGDGEVHSKRMRNAGATVRLVEGDPLRAEVEARAAVGRRHDAVYVSPYNDLDVIAGQGTVGAELLEAATEAPDTIYVATGGGGLVAGIAAAVRKDWPGTRVIACFPAASPVLAHALQNSRITDIPVGATLAGAVAGNIEHDSITLALCASLVSSTRIVEEKEIAEAMRDCLLSDRLVVEGAAGVALAAARRRAEGERAIVVLCGGNVDAGVLSSVLASSR